MRWTASKDESGVWDGAGGVYIHTHIDHPGDWLLSSLYDRRINKVFLEQYVQGETKPSEQGFAVAEEYLTRFYTKRLQELTKAPKVKVTRRNCDYCHFLAGSASCQRSHP